MESRARKNRLVGLTQESSDRISHSLAVGFASLGVLSADAWDDLAGNRRDTAVLFSLA